MFGNKTTEVFTTIAEKGSMHTDGGYVKASDLPSGTDCKPSHENPDRLPEEIETMPLSDQNPEDCLAPFDPEKDDPSDLAATPETLTTELPIEYDAMPYGVTGHGMDKPSGIDVLYSQNSENTDVNGTRPLSEEERQSLKEKLGWSDKQLDKCTIDENGVIHYRTDREDLEGKTSENGVPYERKTIVINGVTIEGVFPTFESKYDAQLPEDLIKASNPRQFAECNRQLKDAVENDPNLAKQFTKEQLEDIANGDTPEGYTWHHNEETGKMQLVKTSDHDRTQGGAAHTGGKALWGGKYEESDSSENSEKSDNSAVNNLEVE